ncbi:hypothetical protein ACHAXA_001023 [Cyclostephanos tholiformis]|uniref:Uncharacterized protein n=1 Tax=Cyclostephanos tholiformis TaxID=382380 RepID=A0ABD3R6W9_9STRA
MLLAEHLARAVSSSTTLRGILDGITVGVSSMPSNSAPGLEACVEAVERSARERRVASVSFSSSSSSSSSSPPRRGGAKMGRNDTWRSNDDDVVARRSRGGRDRALLGRLRVVSPERSPLAIVAMRPEDLECFEDHRRNHRNRHNTTNNRFGDTPTSDREDGSDGGTRMMNCRISTEWNGMGEYNSFADRAMKEWRRAWCDDVFFEGADINGCGGNVRSKVPCIKRRSRREVANDDDMKDGISEQISTVMVIIFLAVVAAQVWSNCRDSLYTYFIR